MKAKYLAWGTGGLAGFILAQGVIFQSRLSLFAGVVMVIVSAMFALAREDE